MDPLLAPVSGRAPRAQVARTGAVLAALSLLALLNIRWIWQPPGSPEFTESVPATFWGPIRPPVAAVKVQEPPDDAPGLTLSIVLPCAYEYENMIRTVQSVYNATPSHILKEIVVLDDASDPPIAPYIPHPEAWKAKLLRHETASGLIQAKQDGADAASGDIVVFLDCHVKPAEDWWRPIVSNIQENYRRVVVPTITNLDVETWTEFGRPPPGGAAHIYQIACGAACRLTRLPLDAQARGCLSAI